MTWARAGDLPASRMKQWSNPRTGAGMTMGGEIPVSSDSWFSPKITGLALKFRDVEVSAG